MPGEGTFQRQFARQPPMLASALGTETHNLRPTLLKWRWVRVTS